MSDKPTHLLVIEDDPNLGYLLREYLQMNDFKVTLVTNVASALEKVQEDYFDLAVLDVMLPDGNGFDLAKAIQTHQPSLPFLFLTARSLKVDVLKGFALGAVDYLKKPIDEEELVVRIRSLVSRLGANKSTAVDTKDVKLIRIGAYTFDPGLQELRRDGQIHSLSKRESDLLGFLAAKPNELVFHKDILVSLWGKNDYFNKKSLNVFISRLRKYLQDDSTVQIDNVHNKGFVLRVE